MKEDYSNVAYQIPEMMIRQNIMDIKLSVVYDLIKVLEVYRKSEPEMLAIIEEMIKKPIEDHKGKTGIQLIVEGKTKDLIYCLEHRLE